MKMMTDACLHDWMPGTSVKACPVAVGAKSNSEAAFVIQILWPFLAMQARGMHTVQQLMTGQRMISVYFFLRNQEEPGAPTVNRLNQNRVQLTKETNRARTRES